MTERGMSKIVRKASRFGGVNVNSTQLLDQGRILVLQFLGDTPSDLSDLERMGESVVKSIALLGRSYLGYLGQARKCTGIQNPVPVSLGTGSPIWCKFTVETIFLGCFI